MLWINDYILSLSCSLSCIYQWLQKKQKTVLGQKKTSNQCFTMTLAMLCQVTTVVSTPRHSVGGALFPLPNQQRVVHCVALVAVPPNPWQSMTKWDMISRWQLVCFNGIDGNENPFWVFPKSTGFLLKEKCLFNPDSDVCGIHNLHHLYGYGLLNAWTNRCWSANSKRDRYCILQFRRETFPRHGINHDGRLSFC